MIDDVAYFRRLILARCPEISAGISRLSLDRRATRRRARRRATILLGACGARRRASATPWLRFAGQIR